MNKFNMFALSIAMLLCLSAIRAAPAETTAKITKKSQETVFCALDEPCNWNWMGLLEKDPVIISQLKNTRRCVCSPHQICMESEGDELASYTFYCQNIPEEGDENKLG